MYHVESPGQYKTHVEAWVCEYVANIKINAKPYIDGKQVRCIQIDKLARSSSHSRMAVAILTKKEKMIRCWQDK
jgi:hypothetical protein